MLEDFISDPQADVGTGLVTTRNSGLFCFTLKQKSRWGLDSITQACILPFGGIGGKVEAGELPAASLHRECIEEVGVDLKISESPDSTLLIDAEKIQEISLTTRIENEPLPRVIFRSPRAESARKPFTNVLIYEGVFLSKEITPIDDPALIELSAELLIQLAKEPMPVCNFKQAGGLITSRIEIPHNGLLKPIGTAFALAKCLESGWQFL